MDIISVIWIRAKFMMNASKGIMMILFLKNFVFASISAEYEWLISFHKQLQIYQEGKIGMTKLFSNLQSPNTDNYTYLSFLKSTLSKHLYNSSFWPRV